MDFIKNTKPWSTGADALKNRLNILNISPTEIDCYTFLLVKGENSIWNISKGISMPRTTVYRTIESLVRKGFVVEKISGKSKQYEAIISDKLENIVIEKERELKRLKKNIKSISQELLQLATIPKSKYKVLHYQGLDGLKRVTWNSRKAQDTFRIFEIDLLSTTVDAEFAEEMRIEFAKMPIKFKQLTNRSHFEDFTRVASHIKQWEPRHIPKELLNIQIEMQIYNDVVCMYDYTDNDIFIIEIYNQKLANMQKQIFDTFWNLGQSMKIVSPYGAAVLA